MDALRWDVYLDYCCNIAGRADGDDDVEVISVRPSQPVSSRRERRRRAAKQGAELQPDVLNLLDDIEQDVVMLQAEDIGSVAAAAPLGGRKRNK